MIRAAITRLSAASRLARLIGLLGVASVVAASFAVVPSLAGWTHTEYDNGPASTLNCSAGATVNTQGYGQLVSGEVAGNTLTSDLAAIAPLTVSNQAPATTSSASGATPATNIGGDAWTSTLNVQALDNVSVTPTVHLPINSSLTVGTQYARATAGGIATGASGAVSGAGNGTVSFQPTGSATPFGSIDLGAALTSVVGSQLASDVTQLSDASLTVGALGSISDEENGCQNLWQGIQNTAASVARSYLLSDLDLNLTSSLVGKTTTAISSAVTGLGTTLNALEPSGTVLDTTAVDPITHTSLNGVLDGLLNVGSIVPGVNLAVSGTPTAQVGVTFDLSSIASLLTTPISANGVTVNLGAGTVTVDLATLLGTTNLNGLPANSSLLTSTNVNAIASAITSSIATLINTTVNNAIKALITSAQVTVTMTSTLAATVLITTLPVLTANITLSGTLGDFVDEAHNSAPTVGVSLTALGGASGLLGASLTPLETKVTSVLTAGILAPTLPIVDDLVLNSVDTNALADLASTLTTLTSGPIATIDTAFGTVLGVLQHAVSLTVNAQPDQAGGVGTPDGSSATPGRFFDSALVVGVVDSGNAPVLGLYLGSSSAGPVSLR